MSRLERAFPVHSLSRRVGYDWEKTMDPKTLERHKWLTKIWTELYFKNQDDAIMLMLQDKGAEHESSVLEGVKRQGLTIEDIGLSSDNGYSHTTDQ